MRKEKNVMKKLLATLLATLLLNAFSLSVSAESIPETLTAPTAVSAENLLVEEYQYRTLIYFTLGDDIINVLSSAPSLYSALTLEGKLYLQFSIDGANWINYYFADYDEENKEIRTTAKKLTLARQNAVSVLSLIQEGDRSQLPEGAYFYDETCPENSYLLVEEHEFRFRVRVELEWIGTDTLTKQSVSSDWSRAAKAETTVSEETMPSELRTPIIMHVEPKNGAQSAEIHLTAKSPIQVSLINSFLAEQGGGVETQAQISLAGGEWLDMTSVSGDTEVAGFAIPEQLNIRSASEAKTNGLRVRFRYSAKGRELVSEWTEEITVGEYIPQELNPNFAKPSFMLSSFLGIKVWVWLTLCGIGILAAMAAVLIRGRRY